MDCSACGAPLTPAAVFCSRCGARVPPQGYDVDELTHTVVRPALAPGFAPPSAEERHRTGATPPTAVSDTANTLQVPVMPDDIHRMWWVLLPDGTRSDIIVPLLLGRRPTLGPDMAGTRLVPVPDFEGTVSRNHAILEPHQAAIRVTNCSTKNPIAVEWPDGLRYTIQPGQVLVVTNSCVIRLGTATLLLQHS